MEGPCCYLAACYCAGTASGAAPGASAAKVGAVASGSTQMDVLYLPVLIPSSCNADRQGLLLRMSAQLPRRLRIFHGARHLTAGRGYIRAATRRQRMTHVGISEPGVVGNIDKGVVLLIIYSPDSQCLQTYLREVEMQCSHNCSHGSAPHSSWC